MNNKSHRVLPRAVVALFARAVAVLVVLVALAGCPPSTPAPTLDAGPCALQVSLGTGSRSAFTGLDDDDAVQVVHGFQGFLMLRLSLAVEGTAASTVEVAWHIEVPDTLTTVDQRDSFAPLSLTTGNAGVVEDWLVFFNDALASNLIGHAANVQVIVHAGACTGGAQVRIALRDDNPCIDPDASVPDAGTLDGGVIDAAVCGSPP